MHTTASDGVLSPSQVVLRAKEKGVGLIAITDHDTVSGLPEGRATAQAYGIRLIAGVEISADGENEVHVLGYGVSENSVKLLALFARMKEERLQRAQRILEKLRALNMPIDWAEIPQQQGVVGRPRIARVMVAKGYAQSVSEAFERFIGNGKPAYVPREPLAVRDAVALLRQEGAVPVLAHPGAIKMRPETVLAALPDWIDAGLMGIEVYHPAHQPNAFARWEWAAERYGLLVTGGSDFHEVGDKHGDIGQMIPAWRACQTDVQRLLAHLE